jgi:hypothetical protein
VSVSIQFEWEMKRVILHKTGMLVYILHNGFVMTSVSDILLLLLLLAKSVAPYLDHVIILVHKPYRADINI